MKKSVRQSLLLLKDVDAFGKKGEIVQARRGYARNFLIPQGVAVVATDHALRKQERLRKEREEQAVIDLQESTALAARLQGLQLEIRVKVDPEGKMYGSVTLQDILELFAKQGLPVAKKYLLMTKSIKETGHLEVPLRLKEGVEVRCKLHVIPEGGKRQEPVPTSEPPATTSS
jgi:large subunit ribosomal protein L9